MMWVKWELNNLLLHSQHWSRQATISLEPLEVRTTPRNEICTCQFCCDMMPLDMTDYFILPAAPNFAFGITISQSSPSSINVLGLRDMPLVPQYQTSPLQTMIRVDQQVLNQGPRLLSFRISKF